MAMTWDMITSGPNAGEIIRPPVYTTTEADATRVRVFLSLATVLGSYVFDLEDGLPVERMLAPDASDAERSSYVRDLVLRDPGVEEIIGEPIVTTTDGTLAIEATFRTTTGVVITVGG
jgi:hypothetical protein